jgi:single-stranded DNA-binding protein
MTIPVVLIAGRISRGPERRQTSSGALFTALILQVQAARNISEFWRVMAFSESAQAGLADLAVGDGLAVAGMLRVEIAERKGRLSFSVTASRVLRLAPDERARLSLTVEPREARHA